MYIPAIVCVVIVTTGHTCGYSNLQQYLDTQTKLLDNMEAQLHGRASHFDLLNDRLSRVLSERSGRFVNGTSFGNGVVASITTVRRLAEDWAALASMLGRYTALSTMGLNGVRWPTQEDVEAAAKALVRVHFTYTAQSGSLVGGNLTDNFSYSAMTAVDCFNVALQYYKHRNSEATGWLQQALSKVSSGDSSVPHHRVLQYLAAANCFLGNSLFSQSVLSALLKKYPGYHLPDALINDFHLLVSNGCGIHSEVFETMEPNENNFDETHKRLCQIPEKIQEGLRCRYVHYQQPHLRFQPFKLEELHLDPPVLRFYDVITKTEVEELQGIAKKRMEFAKTLGKDGPEVSDTRTSHVAWVHSLRSPVTRRLQQRIADITRMDLTYAEPHQLSRYSLGGEYLPHSDSFATLFYDYEDDRLATLMFYLNDVEQGGNTVFLKWKLSVSPIKYSAILWFHFLPNGKEDPNTTHSGCPVIEGEKWVLNKWIHNGGNEFAFPCALTEDGSFRDYYL